MSDEQEQYLLDVDGVSKAFGSVIALREGKLQVAGGSIHALIGENGAGKSTLVKLVSGLYHPDSGTIRVGGEEMSFRTPHDSKDAGISVIYQEPTLFPDLSVAENIFMTRQPRTRSGRMDRARMNRECRELLQRFGIELDPDRAAMGLSIADQQIVEIAKAISMDSRIVIMDEPTAALSSSEVERLMVIARSLRDDGRAVVFISHRFEEVFALCDTVTVMRDGAWIATTRIAETTVPDLVRQMVGRDVAELFPKLPSEIGDVVLSVEGLNRTGVFHDITFEVRSGEIVGLAGLVGSGRSEIARAIFGVDRFDSGTVSVNGVALTGGKPSEAMAKGIALVPEDRRQQGVAVDWPIAKNIALTMRKALSRLGLITERAENNLAADWVRELQVKAAALDTEVGTLSGGNQQKVVLGKWLATGPRLLIVDEPTRGIDVGTKAQVHRIISELAVSGVAVLLISSELPEVMGMSDRVIVISEGRIADSLDREGATAEAIMHAATNSVRTIA